MFSRRTCADHATRCCGAQCRRNKPPGRDATLDAVRWPPASGKPSTGRADYPAYPAAKGRLAHAIRHRDRRPPGGARPRRTAAACESMEPALRSIGSSPRVRGTLLGTPGIGSGVRFIPACAGNSRWTRFPLPVRRGSSPRVRGTPRRRRRRPPSPPVHPRVCGELSRGRPPRHGASRFIPACAGNSLGVVLSAKRLPGSSPRVRGTPQGGAPAWPQRRFIPACAGNSLAAAGWRAFGAGSSPRVRGTRNPSRNDQGGRSVHPRVCGELWMGSGRVMGSSGSSPRVRGTLVWPHPGNPRHQVHPRVCGELAVDRARAAQPCGSSPRVRGTPNAVDVRRKDCAVHPRVCGELRDGVGGAMRPYRFIPACAGNSTSCA